MISLATVKQLPVVSQAIGFVTNKLRLFLEYVLIALLLGVAGALVVMWLQSKLQAQKLEHAQTQVATLTMQNQMNSRTIVRLMELRQRDAEALKGLLDDNHMLYASDKQARDRVAALEREDESVRKYLSQPVPASLAGLLNSETAGPGAEARTPSSGSARTLPAPGKTPNRPDR